MVLLGNRSHDGLVSCDGLCSQDVDETVTSLVCRLTMIPPSTHDGVSKIVTVQSVR